MSSFVCEKCDYRCCKVSDWDKHLKTKKHVGFNKSSRFVAECKHCDYICCKQSLLDRHKLTNKHKLQLLNTSDDVMSGENINTDDGRLLPSQIGTLKKIPDLSPNNYMSLITQLLNQNSDLKNFIIEQAYEHKKETSEIVNKVIEQANEHKKETLEIVNKVIEQSKSINNTTTITNTSNKAFNINLYLNEQCKDAMNFSDFINGIEVSHEDLENNAQLGFVGGISKILIDNLKLMNKNERPIHCTDVKRETMYIKDDNKWTKEEDDSKLRSAIQEITRKSICSLIGWKRGNPESDDMDSVFSGRCIVIQQQSMAGYNREVYYPKVIHAIAREVFVSK